MSVIDYGQTSTLPAGALTPWLPRPSMPSTGSQDMTPREVALLELRRAAAKRMSAVDVDRIATAAEGWAEEERVARLVRRLNAIHPATHAARVPCDWREPSPNRAGDV